MQKSDSLLPARDRLATLPEGIPELTLGWGVAAWCQQNLEQPNGPTAGQPFVLTFDQLRFILWWYALNPDGSWVFNHGVRRLAKGSGKSPFAAVLALAEFLGPVRLSHFDPAVEGGCVGRPVHMPLVQIVATSLEQTKNTMRMVRAFASKKSKLAQRYELDLGKTQIHKLPEGTLETITSSVESAEGAETSFAIADETEHWRPGNNGIELMETIQDNLAKSGNRLIETSNAWVPGADTVAESSYDAWLAQQDGLALGVMGILYDARVCPADTDLTDKESTAAALRWVYADCDWKKGADGEIDISFQLERCLALTGSASAVMRKYMNRPTVAEDAWAAPEEWSHMSDPSRVVPDGEEIVAFFDGSKSSDATSLIGCTVEDGHIFSLGVWEPDPGSDEVVPVREVDAAVKRMFDKYSVVAFYGDVKEWESFTKVSWPDEFGDRLEIHAVEGGKDPQPVAWDMRTKLYDFTTAAELCLAEIEGGEFTHDGDSAVARHVGNARRDANRYGVSIRKESRSSTRKIDACVCVIGVRMVRRRLLAYRGKPATKKKPGRAVAWR